MPFRRRILLSNLMLLTGLVCRLVLHRRDETHVFEQNQLPGFSSKVIGNLG